MADENLQRREVPTQHHCDRFLVKERVYTQQYAGIYFSRLNMLRPRVIASAKERWDKPGGTIKLLFSKAGLEAQNYEVQRHRHIYLGY